MSRPDAQRDFLLARLKRAAGFEPEAEAPVAVLAEIAGLVYGDDESRCSTCPASDDEWADLAFRPVPGHLARKVIARLAGKLLSVGVDPLLALALLQAHNLVRCDPPLHPAEVERVVRWVAAREAEKLETAA